MSGPDPIGNDRRRSRRKRGLPPDAACTFCGWQTPEALLRIDRDLLEQDHVDGAANTPDLVTALCPSCHTVRSEGQRRLGVDLRHDERRSLLERQAAALRSRAVFHRNLAAAEERQSAQLDAFIAVLDGECPGWREWPEVHG